MGVWSRHPKSADGEAQTEMLCLDSKPPILLQMTFTARTSCAWYKKAKKSVAPVRAWLELLRMATNPSSEWAIAEAQKSAMLDEHKRLLTEMRFSGELDKLIRERALAIGGFFREDEIKRHYLWRKM
ncbi:hypothetical protein AB7M71_010470 [Bradyrhizobium japonicum]